MNTTVNSRPRPFRLMALMAILSITACAASGPTVHDRLDPLTGVTVTFVNSPLMLFRDNPARAAYARNFLHLGPIQVNRGGSNRHYLWLGIWSTMERTDTTDYRSSFESIILFADGEPLSLELAGWTPEAINLSAPPYLKPVASTADGYYEVTADQIRLIAAAGDISLRTTGSSSGDYEMWDKQVAARHDLTEFARIATW